MAPSGYVPICDATSCRHPQLPHVTSAHKRLTSLRCLRDWPLGSGGQAVGQAEFCGGGLKQVETSRAIVISSPYQVITGLMSSLQISSSFHPCDFTLLWRSKPTRKVGRYLVGYMVVTWSGSSFLTILGIGCQNVNRNKTQRKKTEERKGEKRTQSITLGELVTSRLSPLLRSALRSESGSRRLAQSDAASSAGSGGASPASPASSRGSVAGGD